jgi:hypothetical protein
MKVNDLIILDKINTLYNFYIKRAEEASMPQILQMSYPNSLIADAKEFVRRMAVYEFEKAKMKLLYENSTHIKIPAINFIDNSIIKTYRSLNYNNRVEVIDILFKAIEANNIYAGITAFSFIKLFPSVRTVSAADGVLNLLKKDIKFTDAIPDNDLFFINKRTYELVSTTLLYKNNKFIDNE